MFDLGFEPQITSILSERHFSSVIFPYYPSLGNIRADRQTALFSATFPPHIEGVPKLSIR